MEQTAELRRVVLEKLQRNGTLDRIQAELRSAIFLAIEENGNDEIQQETSDNIAGYSLIYHYLRQKHFLATAAVFCKEIRQIPIPLEELNGHRNRYLLELVKNDVVLRQCDEGSKQAEQLKNSCQTEKVNNNETLSESFSSKLTPYGTRRDGETISSILSHGKIDDGAPSLFYRDFNKKPEPTSSDASGSSNSILKKTDTLDRKDIVTNDKIESSTLSTVSSFDFNKKTENNSNNVGRSSYRTGLPDKKGVVERKSIDGVMAPSSTSSTSSFGATRKPERISNNANRRASRANPSEQNIVDEGSVTPVSSLKLLGGNKKPEYFSDGVSGSRMNTPAQKYVTEQHGTNDLMLSSTSSLSSFSTNKKGERMSSNGTSKNTSRTSSTSQKNVDADDSVVASSSRSSVTSFVNKMGRSTNTEAIKVTDRSSSSKNSTPHTHRSTTQLENEKALSGDTASTNSKTSIPVRVNGPELGSKLPKLPALTSLPKLQPNSNKSFFSKHLDEVLRTDSLTEDEIVEDITVDDILKTGESSGSLSF